VTGVSRGDELGQYLAQFFDIHAAGTQHLCGGGIIQHCEQKMLDGDELMPLLASLDERQVQTYFQFLRNHLIFLHAAS